MDTNIFLQDNPIFSNNPMFVLKLLDEEHKHEYLKLVLGYSTVNDSSLSDAFCEDIWQRRINDHTVTYSILSPQTLEFMGYCQYKNLSTTKPDIGIEILPQFQRQGIGYAVCCTLIRTFFEKTSCSEIYYKVERKNAPSIALIEKLGGKRDGVHYTHEQLLSILHAMSTEEIAKQGCNASAFIAALEQYSHELSEQEYPTDILIYRIDRDTYNTNTREIFAPPKS